MNRNLESNQVTEPIQPDIGCGIEFEGRTYDESWGMVKTYLHEGDTRDGLRIVRMETRTWVGTMAIGAVHYYANLKWGSCHICNLDGSPHPKAGYYPNGKPEIADSTDIEIVRPVTKRDRRYAELMGEDKCMWPKIGNHTRGFWTEQEAKDFTTAFFKKRFAPGWVLLGHNEEGDEIEIARS